MTTSDTADTARALVALGKGILAADESGPTIQKRFDSIGVESTEESRRNYREMLFSTEGAAEHVSGVILFDETLRQSARDGRRLVDVIREQGMIPGIKVDRGAKPLAGSHGEKVTEGLDGLAQRLAEYGELGARFAKWRAVITIGSGIPTRACIQANAHALARYAALCQAAGLVPIVEPEVLMDGDHSIDRTEEVTGETLQAVFSELYDQAVALEEMLLKPNMVMSGYDCTVQATVEEVAEATVRCFRRHVPAAVPGIVFLSGGQSDERASAHLSAMNRLAARVPWQLSFSFGRALQAPALAAWGGEQAAEPAGQAAYLHRARMNGAARSGAYTEALEAEAPARGDARGTPLVSQD